MEKKYFGVMLDMSRNGVMNIATLKKYIDNLSLFGYNMLQLYTEDTYEVNNEPYFGYLRGGYKKAEIKEIDEYCKQKGIELIPCIQTLAHIRNIFRYSVYDSVRDFGDILLIDEPRTYELIENMFSTLAECFTSRKVHIGMDEAFMVGLGNYRTKHGICDRYDLLVRHLNKVVEIAKKYNFHPMMWSDMFFRMSNNGEYYVNKTEIPEDVISKIPDVSLVYWDYYHRHKMDYANMIKAHKQFNKDIWFAGGAWTWNGFAPSNDITLKTMKPAMDACRENGVNQIFLTLWGDNGKECSYFTVLPSLYYIKRYYEGEKDRNKIAQEFEKLTGESFDKMFFFDNANYVGGNRDGFNNPSKFMLYNDPFFGWFDSVCQEQVPNEFRKLSNRYLKYSRQSKNYGYIFDMYSKLCRVLYTKYDLGVKARAAYQEKDDIKLKEVVATFKKTEKAVKEYIYSFRNLWYKENKPSGLEIHDLRLGGLLQRLRTCRERIESYLEGKIDSIEELEEVLLDYWCGKADAKKTPAYLDWSGAITANNIS